jgi:hypothetical protein
MTLEDMPQWYRVANDASRGALAVFRGDYHSARTTLEAAAAELENLGSPEIEGAWFAPNDPLAAMYAYVALTRFIQGDLAGAETAFAQMERRCEKLRFPHGAFTLCYGRAMETWTRIEAGQFDRAVELSEEIARWGEQHGFDEWVGIATCNQVSVAARAALVSGEAEPAVLQGLIGNMTAVVEAWRAIDRKAFLGGYDATLAGLLTAAGMKDAARERVELALQMADETEWHMYDAELLRIRAHTTDEPDAQHTGLRAAIELAQTQGAPVFELRAAADDFELVGEAARAPLAAALSRFPADQDWPELARARALLG